MAMMKGKVYYSLSSLETRGMACRTTQGSATVRWAGRLKEREIVGKSLSYGFQEKEWAREDKQTCWRTGWLDYFQQALGPNDWIHIYGNRKIRDDEGRCLVAMEQLVCIWNACSQAGKLFTISRNYLALAGESLRGQEGPKCQCMGIQKMKDWVILTVFKVMNIDEIGALGTLIQRSARWKRSSKENW